MSTSLITESNVVTKNWDKLAHGDVLAMTHKTSVSMPPYWNQLIFQDQFGIEYIKLENVKA